MEAGKHALSPAGSYGQLCGQKRKQQHTYRRMGRHRTVSYTHLIVYDDEILYSNADGMALDGEKGELPDGYNFLLYFDGEKVTIKKNGKDLNLSRIHI